MRGDKVLHIELRDGLLYEADTAVKLGRGDIAMMIASGRKYKVIDPESGQDMTHDLGRHLSRINY